MARTTSLDLLKESTAELVAQGLRSDAAVIARLVGLIVEAGRMGHSHRSIHQAITAGGLATSWNNYRIALGRARKAQRTSRPPDGASHALPTLGTGALPVETLRGAAWTSSTRQHSGETGNSGGSSSAIGVMDALRRAREVAAKDYSRIALDLHRQGQRNRQRKDPP